MGFDKAVLDHADKHESIAVKISTTLDPGRVACINPVPHLFGAEIHCRDEDYSRVMDLLRTKGDDND